MSIVEKFHLANYSVGLQKGIHWCFVLLCFQSFHSFRFSSFRLSTGSDQLTTRTYSSNLIGLLFEPTILLLIIGGLLYLAWKEKHWIRELMYPVVVLLLIVIGTILY